MIYGDNEQCSKSEVQSKNTKQEPNKHGLLKKVKLELGAMKELAFSSDRSHPPYALCRNRGQTEKPEYN